jgi:L-cysteine desulfidase
MKEEDADGRSAQLKETCQRGQIIARRAINVSQESKLAARSFLAAISEPNIEIQDIHTAVSNLCDAVRNLETESRNTEDFTRDLEDIDKYVRVIKEHFLRTIQMLKEANCALTTAALEIQKSVQECLSFAKFGG